MGARIWALKGLRSLIFPNPGGNKSGKCGIKPGTNGHSPTGIGEVTEGSVWRADLFHNGLEQGAKKSPLFPNRVLHRESGGVLAGRVRWGGAGFVVIGRTWDRI